MALFRDSLLAIELAPTGVTVAECNDDCVLKSASFSWPPQINSATQPQIAGQWLAQQIAAAGIATRKAVVVVPRQHAPLKLLEAPLVADDELAALVQLQAENRLAKSLDEFHFDFIAHPPMPGATTRRVLLATTLRSALDPMLAIAQAAGLQVVAATVAEAAVSMLADRAVVSSARNEARSATSISVNVSAVIAGDQSVLIASHDGRAFGSLPVRLRGNDGSAIDDARLLASSASRLLATVGTEPTTASLGTFIVCGATSQTLLSALQTQLAQPVLRCGEAVPGPLMRLFAAARATAQREGSINFVSPRRPADQAALKRRYRYRVASAAAVLFAMAGWSYWDQGQELDRQITAKKKELSQLNQLIERGQPVVETSAFLSDWQHSKHDWASELKQLSEQLPERERLHLNRLSFETKPQTGTALVRASGTAREASDVAALTEKLVATERYELLPRSITPNARDPLYRANFELEAKVAEGGARASPP